MYILRPWEKIENSLCVILIVIIVCCTCLNL